MSEKIEHVGVLGMRWGRRRAQESQGGGQSKRGFKVQSLTKNMDGRKVNKLFGKRNRKAMGKSVVDALMTPAWSKTKWTDMDKKQKTKTIAITTAGLAVIGAMMLSELR